MFLLDLFSAIDHFLALPSLILFFGVGIFLTLKTRFIQLRAFPHFLTLVRKGVKQHHQVKNEKTISPIQAMLTAMATTIGMGNIVGPSVAIMIGGPGALFWLVAYSFLGAVTKFTEVLFAVNMRTRLQDGTILGGPTQYLKHASVFLSQWYGALTLVMFAGWSGMQANTLASIFAMELVPRWTTGLVLASFTFFILLGGIKRIGQLASKIVPLMCVLYLGFTLSILLSNPAALWAGIKLVFSCAFSPSAAAGGFLGASVFIAMRTGVQRNMHITEAGLGTSSIAHSMTDVDKASDQAVLAMFSIIADTTLAFLSGLLVIVSGRWMTAVFSPTIVYEIFKSYSPGFGKWVLLGSITLFVVTTVIGNSFNASQSFSSFFGTRGLKWLYLVLVTIVFGGALMHVELVWRMMGVIQDLVAIPHVIGLLILTVTYGKLLNIKF